MDPITQQMALAAAGAAGAGEVYVDDVFSTFLYEGTGSAQTINNGIDLSGKGGLVWVKSRDNTSGYSGSNTYHGLFDTERGALRALYSNATSVEAVATGTQDLYQFNNNGFNIGTNFNVDLNYAAGSKYVSWTFRKAPGAFDVVTWSGDSNSGRNIAHNLGSKPGCIMIKSTSGAGDWIVYHQSLGATKNLRLNKTDAAQTASWAFVDTEPTSTHFTVGNDTLVNLTGQTYVAYIFAHDDQSFGAAGNEAIIKCESYSGNGSAAGPAINLGFEPQFVFIKNTSASGAWKMFDIMRGSVFNGEDLSLSANEVTTEVANVNFLDLTSTGFQLKSISADVNQNGSNYIYIAIRRPHKPPTAGTDVFLPAASAGFSSDITTGFPVDVAFQLSRTSGSKALVTRLTGKNSLETRLTGAESVNATNAWYESNTKLLNTGLFSADGAFHLFKRAPGFMDVVGYSGTGSDQVVNHGLGVTPELMIAKARSTSTAWRVFYKDSGTEKNLQLSGVNAAGNISASHPWSPTATTFRADQYFSLSASGHTFVAYLFATLPGISKVGLYTGTGNAIDVDCGFSSGARYLLIKRTDSNGDWYVWDTARGIVSGNDPYLLLNDSAGDVTNTDYIDPLNSGFTVTSSAPAGLNASGGTYMFLAIA